MKTEFLKGLIPDTVPNRDQIIADIFAENGRDIAAAKEPFKDYESLKTQLVTAQSTITTLEAAKGDTAKLQTELDKYKTAETARLAQEEADRVNRGIAARFTVARGTAEFLDPLVEAAVLEAFKVAVLNPANQGKGDTEIYASLTKDKPYFKGQNNPPDMGPGAGGDNGGGANTGGVTLKAFQEMSLVERTNFRDKNPEAYNTLRTMANAQRK